MDLETFIEDRRPRWTRLERLLDEARDAPEGLLGRDRLHELLLLYRGACADLNQARALTANPELLGFINQLTGRAYRFIYRGRPRARLDWRALLRFFARDVPGTFRREERVVRLAASALLLGVALGVAAVLVDPALARLLVPEQMSTRSPQKRVVQIETGEERIDTLSKATEFGSYLYTHNLQVSFLTFALGALTLIGGWAMLFYNGVLLGVVATTYLLDGVGTFFIAWVGPHGALELPSIVFAGAAGLCLGRALLLPGDRGRPAALRLALPAVFHMLSATALLLLCAGLIEGSFSQMSARTVNYPVKIAVAISLFGALCLWLFAGKEKR